MFRPLNRAALISRHAGSLPHWRQRGVTYFVTFRLADALPQSQLAALRDERLAWLRAHGLREPSDVAQLSAAEQREYYRRFAWRTQRWLDAAHGSCRLRRPDAAAIVEAALRHFDEVRYRLGAWVVMPNHVHVLVEPLGAWSLGDIVGSWKKFAARRINELDGKTGSFWQEESYDHIVRTLGQLRRIESYIRANPGKARLRGGEYRVGGFDAEPGSGEPGHESVSRRVFLGLLAAGTVPAFAQGGFRLNYLLSSAMYGTAPLAEIVPEVARTGATHLDVWPRKHGDQREQMDAMGHDAFAALLAQHGVKLGCLTRYDLGPFGLADELKVAQRFGCRTIMTGAKGPKGLAGPELRAAVEKFAEEMKPHCALAEKHGVTIAIENHANGLLESPDSIRWLVEFAPPALGIAFAPYHLPQEESLLAALLRECGRALTVFIAWQHGKGCMAPQPKADELLQMPGRGPLDFGPLLAALREIAFTGWTNIFMHPFPRGIPIVAGGVSAVSAEINRARAYLDGKL